MPPGPAARWRLATASLARVPSGVGHGVWSDALLSPSSVGVIGAPGDPASIAQRIHTNLELSFAGRLIHAEVDETDHEELEGRLEPVELAIVAAPNRLVPTIVAACAARGVTAAVICSSGFPAAGCSTDALAEALRCIAASTGIRVLGPNCLGLISMPAGLRATFAPISFAERQGNVAILGQSGALALVSYELALRDGLGVSYWCATGREIDVCAAELAGDLLERDEVDVVAVVLEGVTRPDLLLSAGRRAAQLNKPLIVMKVGSSPSGGAAAASHTAAVAVPARVFEAACQSAAIALAHSPRELVDLIKAFSVGRLPHGRRMAIITGSGGVGVMMADAADAERFALPDPDEELRSGLGQVLPAHGAIGNPIDYAGSDFLEDRAALRSLLTRIVDSELFDLVCVAGVPDTPAHYRETIRAVGRECSKPYLVYSHQPDTALELTRAGVVALTDPHATMRVARALVAFVEQRERLGDTPPPAPVRGTAPPRTAVLRAGLVVDHEARPLLERYGVSFARERRVSSVDAAVRAAEALGFPVALKVSGDWLAHRSDLGALRLNCPDAASVRVEATELLALARAHGPADTGPSLVVQEMVGPGIELMCGMVRDPTFGPVVAIGAGGPLVEVISEQRLALPPLTTGHAAQLVAALWGGRLAQHPRGPSPRAAQALAHALRAVGELALEEPQIAAIDVNPLIVVGDQVTAVDALIVVSDEPRCDRAREGIAC